MSETTSPQPVSAAPLGLAAFGLNLFILSFSFTGVLAPEVTSVFIAIAIAFGVVQAWAGMYDFRLGNAYNGMVFGSFGAFWVGTGLLFLLMNTKIVDFGTSFPEAMGLYYLAWTVLTFFFWVGSFYVSSVVALTFTVLMGALVSFVLWGFDVVSVKIGAWLAFIDANLALYLAGALVLNPMVGRELLPTGKPLIRPRPARVEAPSGGAAVTA